MRKRRESSPALFSVVLFAFSALTAAGLLLKAGWRANLIWILHSWIAPADRSAAWEQRSGERLDPWNRR